MNSGITFSILTSNLTPSLIEETKSCKNPGFDDLLLKHSMIKSKIISSLSNIRDPVKV